MSNTVDVTHPLAMPPGLSSDIADFICQTSNRPVSLIANVGAITLLSGLAGRAFNTPTGAGLNSYTLMLAPTGTGKEAIHDATAKLLTAAQAQVPAIANFRGPGEIVSPQGTLRALAKNPCQISHVGEIGLRLQLMSSLKANPIDKQNERLLLQLYGKSGDGNVYDGSSYADSLKNIPSLHSPSFTLIGESTPHTFWDGITPEMITSGLLPRFSIYEYDGERPYSNPHCGQQPPAKLVNDIANFGALCLGIMATNRAIKVPATPEAWSRYQQYDDETTDRINDGSDGVIKHMWNRAALKALKLATVSALSVTTQYRYFPDNCASFNPVISLDCMNWAIALVNRQTNHVIGKFERNEVGTSDGDEIKQQNELIKAIGRYMFATDPALFGYNAGQPGFTADMHRDGVISQTFLSRYLCQRAAFRNDRRRGPTEALKRAIDSLLSSDELREMPPTQMLAKYGTKSRSFVMANPQRFSAARSMELGVG